MRQAEAIPAPFIRQSATSRQAAELILPKAGTLRRKVYDFIAGCGPRGATDDEMQARIPMDPSTQRPRRIELHKARLIEAASNTDCTARTRKTRSGRDAVVWVVHSCREER